MAQQVDTSIGMDTLPKLASRRLGGLPPSCRELEEVRVSKVDVVDGGTRGADDVVDDGDGYQAALRRCAWPAASYLILGETFGTGVLGLPRAMANLGWLLGLLCIILFGLVARYSGAMLYRVKRWCHPSVMSYGETGAATLGPLVGQAIAFFIQLNWFLLMPYYLVAGVTSLQSASSSVAALATWQLTLLFAAPLFVLTQLKSLASISALSALSTLSIVIVCVIAVATICSQHLPEPLQAGTSVLPPTGSTFLSAYADMSSFIFAFQGQDMHYEIMREMKVLDHYPRAVTVANSVMVVAYGGVSAAVYAKFGASTPSFLLDAIPSGPWKVTASALATFHVLVAFLLVSQPLIDKLHRATMESAGIRWSAFGNKAGEENEKCSAADSRRGVLVSNGVWLGLTTTALVLALVIANAIPFFNDFQNLLGAFMGSFIVFGGPALFYLRAYKLTGLRAAWFDKVLSCAFLFFLWPVCTLLGTYLAVDDIILHWQKQLLA